MNQLPKHGKDTWFMNSLRDANWPEFGSLPADDVASALTRLFGEPASLPRDIPAEHRLITQLMLDLEQKAGEVRTPIAPATWLNPATGLVEAWDSSAAEALPGPAFAG